MATTKHSFIGTFLSLHVLACVANSNACAHQGSCADDAALLLQVDTSSKSSLREKLEGRILMSAYAQQSDHHIRRCKDKNWCTQQEPVQCGIDEEIRVKCPCTCDKYFLMLSEEELAEQVQSKPKLGFSMPGDKEGAGQRQVKLKSEDAKQPPLIVFAADHKTGSTMIRAIAPVLCRARGWETHEFLFRETPRTCPSNAKGCCFLNNHLYEKDVEHWIELMRDNPQARFVHLEREPIEMVISAYHYHRRGNEKSWTDSRSCSRDLCQPIGDECKGMDKGQGMRYYRNITAKSRLESIGCGEYDTYLKCLEGLPVVFGLEAEAKRSSETISTMLDAHDRIRRGLGNQAKSLCLASFVEESFKATVADLWTFLGDGHDDLGESFQKRSQKVVDDTYQVAFSKKYVNAGAPGDDIPLSGIEKWKKGHVSNEMRSFAKRSTCRAMPPH